MLHANSHSNKREKAVSTEVSKLRVPQRCSLIASNVEESVLMAVFVKRDEVQVYTFTDKPLETRHPKVFIVFFSAPNKTPLQVISTAT